MEKGFTDQISEVLKLTKCIKGGFLCGDIAICAHTKNKDV